MLVINSNTNSDRSNYMLAEPGYPDLDSILMSFGPEVVQNSASGISFNCPTLEEIGTTKINYFCPRITRQGLEQGTLPRSDINSNFFMPDVGIAFGRGRTSSMTAFQMIGKITTAVKGLKQGQIIGEKIIAPLYFFSQYDQAGSFYINKEPTSGTPSVILNFKLLHSDGTTDLIASKTINSSTSKDGGTTTDTTNLINNNGTMFKSAIYVLNYNGTGQTAQEGDYLIAELNLNLKFNYSSPGGSNTGGTARCGLSWGGANNSSLRDINGFRPFQVSIRDA